jgi:hypothetical protein
MPHKDLEARKKYMRERYHRIQAEDPEKKAKLDAKHRRAYEKKLARGEEFKKKQAADYKRWYESGGKESTRTRKGNETWEQYQTRIASDRKKRREYMQRFNASYEGQRARTARSIKERCGLTIDQYDETYDKQEGKCKICGVHGERHGKGRLVVDHCHVSTRFRALLCGPCNSAIGLFQESEDIMLSAIAYIRSWKAA